MDTPTEINPFKSDKGGTRVQNLSITYLTENKIKEVSNSDIKSCNNGKKRHQVKQLRQKRRAVRPPMIQIFCHILLHRPLLLLPKRQ